MVKVLLKTLGHWRHGRHGWHWKLQVWQVTPHAIKFGQRYVERQSELGKGVMWQRWHGWTGHFIITSLLRKSHHPRLCSHSNSYLHLRMLLLVVVLILLMACHFIEEVRKERQAEWCLLLIPWRRMVHGLVHEWSSYFLQALALISEHFDLLP